MPHRALIGNRHGFKSAMWMLAHAAPLFRLLELERSRIVQHQEWIDLALQAIRREKIPHRKAIPYPVVRSRVMRSQYFRSELERSRIVQHQEWIDLALQAIRREKIPHRKAIPYPVVRSRVMRSQYF